MLKVPPLHHLPLWAAMVESRECLKFFLRGYQKCQPLSLLFNTYTCMIQDTIFNVCWVFRPAFRCCAHPKADWPTFFSRFQPFWFIQNLFQWFHTRNQQKTSDYWPDILNCYWRTFLNLTTPSLNHTMSQNGCPRRCVTSFMLSLRSLLF